MILQANAMAGFAVSFTLTLIATPVLIRYSYKSKLLDYPKEKSVHLKPIPMTGGLFIFVIFFLLGYIMKARYNLLPFFLASLPIAAVGFYDDLKGLNAAKKLLFQLIAIIILISFGVVITKVRIPSGSIIEVGHLSIPVTIIWLLFVINLVNLLDGLDGLAVGLCFIVFLVLFMIAGPSPLSLQLSILMGALSAFLIFNFHPARIFLGNSGSSFLGIAVGYFSLVTSQKSSILPILVIPLCIMAVHVIDVFYAIVRRATHGEAIFKGDKAHIHHIMLSSIKDHRLTVLLFYMIALLLSIAILKIFVP